MKYLSLTFIVIVLASLTSVAQECGSRIMTMNQGTDQEYFKFREQISLDDEKWQLALTLDAVTEKKSIIIVLLANPPLCFKKGDSIAFTLTNGRTFLLPNMLDDNCEQRVGVALDFTNGPNATLDSLINLDLASVTIHSDGKKIKGDLRNNRKPLLRSALQCLRDVVTSEAALQSFRNEESNRVFMLADQQPEYSGGHTEMMNFIRKNLKIKKNTKGTIYVTFIIEKDGSLTEPRVLRGISPAADAEALRVVSLMPKWIPATLQGKPVRVRFNLPIKLN